MADIVLHACPKCGMTSQWPAGTQKPACPNCALPGGLLPGVQATAPDGKVTVRQISRETGTGGDKRKRERK